MKPSNKQKRERRKCMDYLVQHDKISPAASTDLAAVRPPPNISFTVLVLANSTKKISPLADQPPPTEKFSPAADHACSLLLALAQVLKPHAYRTRSVMESLYIKREVGGERGRDALWRRFRLEDVHPRSI
jgi:hypothetical protein